MNCTVVLCLLLGIALLSDLKINLVKLLIDLLALHILTGSIITEDDRMTYYALRKGCIIKW